ncbi:MAG: prepilin-type N-terminal cleavage/methylation domain-containing protein, partial [Raoultibacter sp.]
MNEMIKKVRGDKKGFTLAELLIVVAIILVLVAIAIPLFVTATDTASRSVASADIRSTKSEALAMSM